MSDIMSIILLKIACVRCPNISVLVVLCFIEILYGQTFCSCFYCWVIKAVSENLLAIRGGFKHGGRVITLEL